MKMIAIWALLPLYFALCLLPAEAEAQLNLKNLKKKAEKKVEKRIEKKVDEKVDEGLDEIEDSIDGKETKDTKNKSGKKQTTKPETKESKSESSSRGKGVAGANAKSSDPVVIWNKFDFVPGDKVLFEDAPSSSERNGEFPSRWDLVQGQIEIMNFNGEQVIGFISGNPMIIPFIKNSEKDYLPEVFTIEFDVYRPASGNRLNVYLHDYKNQRRTPQERLVVYLDRADYGDVIGEYNSGKSNDEGNWIHVSIAYTKGQLKVYLDENRLLNIPRTAKKPTGISIQPYFANVANNTVWYMKNFRIAEGGVPYYDRAIQDGKIIVTGIKFDIGKSTLRPESMGPLNEIFYVMNQSKDIRFSVEGHTDSDGAEATNQKLSEERAKAVMDKLIEMGIDPSRLKSLGFGQSKPIADNSSPEGKAQNRRVEFVKF